MHRKTILVGTADECKELGQGGIAGAPLPSAGATGGAKNGQNSICKRDSFERKLELD
jgi:hypothetical protein